MKRIISSLCFILLMVGALQASHYSGGYIRYECGQIYLHLFYDCSIGPNPPTTATVVANPVSPCTPSPVNISLGLQSNAEITPICPSTISNCSGGTFTGYLEVIYSGVMITSTCPDWVFSHTNCCRNYTVNSGSGGQVIYLRTDTVDIQTGCDHTPQVLNPPALYQCNNNAAATYSNSAFDADGDSLTYELAPVMQNATTSASYSPGYSYLNPMGPTWTVGLNSATGELSIAPVSTTGAIGNYVVGIKIKQFRNGIYRGSTLYEQQISTINCGGNPPIYCCNSMFSYTQNLNSFVFTPSPNNPTGTSYLWDFGDGTQATTLAASHSYTNTGNYVVSYTVTTVGGCSSTTKYGVHVWSTSSPTPPVISNISIQNMGNGNYQLSPTVTGGTPPYTYVWDNGSTASNAIYYCMTPAGCSACLIVTDGNGLSDTLCTTIVPPTCNANFSFTQSGGLPDTVDFAFNGTAGANATYVWDFANGNTSTNQNPNAVYSTPGLYNVCLYLNDNGACFDTACTSLNVGVGVDLDGYIYTGNATPDSFLVYLIEYDNAGGGTLTAIDSQFVAGAPAYYNFGNVSPNIYYTKAALLPSSPNYWSYIPTYHDSSMFWAGAAAINFISMPPLSPNGDIYMVQGTNPGGPGFIGGLISQGANRIAAGAAANKEVILLDANDQPVAYAYTDANGAYAFNNIPLGSYKVYPEIMNKLTIPYLCSIDAINSSLINADFLISHDSVYPASVNPIYNPALLAGFGKVYPNPTKEKLHVEFSLQQTATLDFELTDMLGRAVWSHQAKFGQGNQQIEMDMKALQAGVYILNVRENENLRLVRKVMKE